MFVKKTYYGDHATERVHYQQQIYKALRDKTVPHVDRLTHVVDMSLYLEPKGIATRPSNEAELLEALVCVLQALQVCNIF